MIMTARSIDMQVLVGSDAHNGSKVSSSNNNNNNNMSSSTFVPGDKDILCGRGRVNFYHKGNELFRKIVGKHLNGYVTARSRVERSVVIKKIAEEIRSMGCRFLKLSSGTDMWYEAGIKVAKQKIGHALRDATAEKNKSIVKIHEKYQEERSGSNTTTNNSESSPLSPVKSEQHQHQQSSMPDNSLASLSLARLSSSGESSAGVVAGQKRKRTSSAQPQNTGSPFSLPPIPQNQQTAVQEQPLSNLMMEANFLANDNKRIRLPTPTIVERQDSYNSADGDYCLDLVNEASLDELEILLLNTDTPTTSNSGGGAQVMIPEHQSSSGHLDWVLSQMYLPL